MTCMTCMVSFSLNRGRGNFLKFFRCSNDFIKQKVYLAVNEVYVGSIKLAAYFSHSH
jgi:hypothetical protein